MSEQTAGTETIEQPRGPGRPRLNPLPTAAPSQGIKWSTPDEIAKANNITGKHYVKLNAEGAVDKSLSKHYFYEVTNVHPYVPREQGNNSNEFLIKVHVQKFHRRKTIKINKQLGDGTTEQIDVPAPVAKWERSEPRESGLGSLKVGELQEVPGEEAADANFLMDYREFISKFTRDKDED